jgi:lipopolysaccharide biosynthesis glycosyltransferase
MIDIVCNIDNNYTKHCCAMLASLFTNNNEEQFHIHIITDNLNIESIHILRKLVKDEYHNRLSVYTISKDILDKCPESNCSHITMAAMYRCFVTSILPKEISRVLFLDCDLVVNGSIHELWNIDISCYAVGAVEDQWNSVKEYYSRLGYPESYAYFNSGVMLINLDYWRTHAVEERIIDYMTKYSERLRFNDQDILNAVLYKEKLFIPFRWNMQDGFYRMRRKLRPASVPAMDKDLQHGVIIHFTGGKKPWHAKCMHPLKCLYYKYLDLTQWKGEKKPVKILAKINYSLLTIQGFLGLKNAYRKIKS